MKILKTIMCGAVIIFSQTIYAQTPYYDALYLKKSKNSNGKIILTNDIQQLLTKYYKGTTTTDITAIFLQNNPFFNSLFKDKGADAIDNLLLKENQKSFSLSSPFSNLNVTNIADGIAQFLIKRGKEELDAAFFSQMKKFLDKHEECQVLFPSTIEFLENIDPYKYSEFLQSLREAFNKDLSNLIVHLNQVIALPQYDTIIAKYPIIRIAIRSANIVSELSQSGNSITPDSLINQLALLPWADVDNNLGNAWNFLNVISQSIRENTSKHRSWVQLSELNQNLFDDPITLRIYIGLIYQQVTKEKIYFKIGSDSISAQKFLFDNQNTVYKISSLIENFSLLANDVDKTVNDFRSKQEKQTLTNDDYYTYINKAINILDYGFKVANTIKNNVVNDKYIIIARNANDLYKNIYTKNYNNAIMNVCTILNQTFIKDSTNKILPGVLKYGNFMASVIKAKSPGDVENAIEAAALPAGSYSIKQRSSWNLSLNGYIGYARDYNSGLYAQGVYAPVGISFSHGSRNNGFTFSAFASIIDVGGIATYRLANGTTDSLKQEVRLGSIFSPSAQLIIEKNKLPLALCVGWRLSPRLIYSKQIGFTTISPTSVFNVGLLIDIPIFTFWNRPFVTK